MSILDSLAATYTDSEDENETTQTEDSIGAGKDETSTLADRLKGGINVETPGSGSSDRSNTPKKLGKGLVEYADPDADVSGDENREPVPMDLESEDEENENGEAEESLQGSAHDELEKSHLMEELWAEGVQLPPEPQGNCSAQLQEKIEQMWQRKVDGRIDFNAMIQNKKAFRNPSIYEKLILHLNIDELGTNFPPDLYDGHLFGKESYYEELNKQQKIEMDKLEKAAEAKKKLGDANVKDALNSLQQRKSKWDQGAPAGSSVAGILPGAIQVSSKSIPAFGVLKKK